MDCNNMGKCRLCLKEKGLCDSHIIPEFLYKTLYNNKHKFIGITENGINTKIQKGFKEYLLCSECEAIFSKYETYVASKIYMPIVENIYDGDHTIIPDVDYTKLKLFLLSLLWRISISGIEQFRNVDLGSRHNENIRTMLCNKDPGDADDYPAIFYLNKSNTIDSMNMVPPRFVGRIDGHRAYKVYTPKVLHLFLVSGHSKPPVANPFTRMLIDGSLPIILLEPKDFDALPEMRIKRFLINSQVGSL